MPFLKLLIFMALEAVPLFWSDAAYGTLECARPPVPYWWGKEAKLNPPEKKQSRNHTPNQLWATTRPNAGPGHNGVQTQECGWLTLTFQWLTGTWLAGDTEGQHWGEVSQLSFQSPSLGSSGGIWHQVPKRAELQNCALEKAQSINKQKTIPSGPMMQTQYPGS